MARYPAPSNRCVELARVVLPCAREVDAQAHALSFKPKGVRARFLITKRPLPRLWSEHVATSTRAHHVDALTGIPGCEAERYLSTHFEFHEHIDVAPVDLSSLAEGSQEGE